MSWGRLGKRVPAARRGAPCGCDGWACDGSGAGVAAAPGSGARGCLGGRHAPRRQFAGCAIRSSPEPHLRRRRSNGCDPHRLACRQWLWQRQRRAIGVVVRVLHLQCNEATLLGVTPGACGVVRCTIALRRRSLTSWRGRPGSCGDLQAGCGDRVDQNGQCRNQQCRQACQQHTAAQSSAQTEQAGQ